MIPTTAISVPDATQLRPVTNVFDAPTRKCATMLIMPAAIIAGNPPKKKKGITGIKAPSAVEMADAAADRVGLGKFSSASP